MQEVEHSIREADAALSSKESRNMLCSLVRLVGPNLRVGKVHLARNLRPGRLHKNFCRPGFPRQLWPFREVSDPMVFSRAAPAQGLQGGALRASREGAEN